MFIFTFVVQIYTDGTLEAYSNLKKSGVPKLKSCHLTLTRYSEQERNRTATSNCQILLALELASPAGPFLHLPKRLRTTFLVRDLSLNYQ